MSDAYLIPALQPQPCTASKLVNQLVALNITGVRTYSIVGTPGICDGVYAWDASAPTGTYQPLQLDTTDQGTVQQTIANHVPDPPPPTLEEQVANALDTITNDTTLDSATRTALTDVVQALSVG